VSFGTSKNLASGDSGGLKEVSSKDVWMYRVYGKRKLLPGDSKGPYYPQTLEVTLTTFEFASRITIPKRSRFHRTGLASSTKHIPIE